jgi:hypothetical protein
MLHEGALRRGIDVLDLAWHGMPLVLLAATLARSAYRWCRTSRRTSRRS